MWVARKGRKEDVRWDSGGAPVGVRRRAGRIEKPSKIESIESLNGPPPSAMHCVPGIFATFQFSILGAMASSFNVSIFQLNRIFLNVSSFNVSIKWHSIEKFNLSIFQTSCQFFNVSMFQCFAPYSIFQFFSMFQFLHRVQFFNIS